MYHFFVEPSQIYDGHACIIGDDVNHIVHVLRMKKGEELLLSDGSECDFLCSIENMSDDKVELIIKSDNEPSRELPSKIYLYQALPKLDKLEYIIQKSVELGVFSVIPVETSRCVVKLDDKKSRSKRERWQSIAEAAAKQSKRSIIPEIKAPISFKSALEDTKDFDIKLIAYENASDIKKTRSILESAKPGQNIAIFIGPEGGFDKSEVDAATECGFSEITLGRRILRTETASLAILSWLMLKLEEV